MSRALTFRTRRRAPVERGRSASPLAAARVSFGRAVRSPTLWDACRKTDVSNLLESAGFSKSNPYYIVQQGKVCTQTLLYPSLPRLPTTPADPG
jgi:hypothetical protein